MDLLKTIHLDMAHMVDMKVIVVMDLLGAMDMLMAMGHLALGMRGKIVPTSSIFSRMSGDCFLIIRFVNRCFGACGGRRVQVRPNAGGGRGAYQGSWS